MKKEPVKRYSQALKHQVVREYEAGQSVYELNRKYGISGSGTVRRWVKQYGREGYRSEVVMIQTVEDQQEVQEMKQRLKELEEALADSVLENRMLRKTLEVAERETGLDLKKNIGR